jgi:hypothetical protein
MSEQPYPDRYVITVSENPARKFTAWDWSVLDTHTGVERFGCSSREAWARHDAEKALRQWKAGKAASRERKAAA